VYHGVAKDYTGAQVTPANFLKVLKGQSEEMKGVGSGKVLGSGPNDNVFVFFSDHGGPGIIAFPSELLQATDLNNALIYMHQNNKYNQLVFYLEACESGSMFNTLLPTNIRIFATTASTPDTSSYACYYDAKRGTYLGDVYSVNWMEDSDKADLTKETLQAQFQIVKRETNTSVCCEYGDQTFNTEPCSYFQSGTHAVASVASPRIPNPNLDAVDSRDVAISILRHKIAATTDAAAKAVLVGELNFILSQRIAMENMYKRIVTQAAGADSVTLHMTRRLPPTRPNMECLRLATSTFDQTCFSYSEYDYGMKLAMSFVSMCEGGVSSDAIVAAIRSVCPSKGVYTGGVNM
jgi:legumain